MSLLRPAEEAPFAGLEPLFGPAALRAADRIASERFAMPSILLMDAAGRATTDAILARWPAAGRAIVLVGAGNNGGDGMVVARGLRDAGWAVDVRSPGGEAPRRGDAGVMSAIAAAMGIGVGPARRRRGDGGAVLVDALLGTGARGAPRDAYAAAIELIGRHDGPVVSVDLPSGVDAATGEVPGPSVRADLTVTYGGDTIGLRIEPGRAHAGEVIVADIGFPGGTAVPADAWRATRRAAEVGSKPASGEKYGAGAVLTVAGAPGLTGAGTLAARAVLRSGGGLSVLAVPAGVQPLMAVQAAEVMCVPVPDEGGHLCAASVDEVLAQAGRVGAVALGPGLGRAGATTPAVERLVASLDLPLVIDADGLWHLGRPAGPLAGGAPRILTPHAGEAARLLGVDRGRVEAGRLAAAAELAERTGAVVVLKGPGTITCRAGHPPIVNDTGSAALSTAGSGDVLTGVIAALLARGGDPLHAAAGGVALHGLAGELTGAGDGTVAGDVVDALPAALRAAAA